ncbi:adenylate/guanylate cyclase domain-containing protein [Erythrobacter sp. HKB08]|uniref:adenylate/guanylate cyclase domain-containing protein n=1 Tax=Erythrobacter sp. HKB08 TaxID=2502843 RepID=UPI0013E8D4E7|nr:adenylate/guanylate cyclase domain-containing protein [Erythrobacter sp. HKB08]
MQLGEAIGLGEGESRAGKRKGLIAACLILLASLVPPLVSPGLPPLSSVERLAHDIYAYLLAPTSSQRDPDIALLLYDDATARVSQKTSPIDRQVLANAIRAADEGGAKMIGIDFFFAQPTDDEDVLTEALASSKTPIVMLYADPKRDGGGFWSPSIASESAAHQDLIWRKIAGGDVTRSSPMIGTDEANVARRWPRRDGAVEDAVAQIPLSAAVAGMEEEGFAYEGSISFTRYVPDAEAGSPPGSEAAGVFPDFSMSAFQSPEAAARMGPLFRDKYVLIGLGIFNADRFATPITRIAGEDEIPGVAVHAHMLRQALDGDFPAPLPWWLALFVALLLALAGAVTGTRDRSSTLFALATVGLLALWASLAPLLRWAGFDLLSIPVFGWLLTLGIALGGFSYLAGARTSRERRFARGALGKYLPATVAQEILADPEKLELKGEERELFMLFTDLEGFTRISHNQQPQTTAEILNRYLDEMSEVILRHEGTIDKFVGDAIVAFWGAPIGKPEDAKNAVACALALHEKAEAFRAEVAKQGEQLGRTRIGLHCGKVIVGNFGGRQRIQYTALGDAMNTAARLEGANKYLGSHILVSESVRKAASHFAYMPLGSIVMSGVDTPIPVYQPVGTEQRDRAEAVAAALAEGLAGREKLAALSAKDPAIASLVERWETVGKGEAYVLGSK